MRLRIVTRAGSEIKRALHFFDRSARNAVGIDHRGAHVCVAEERLDRADVVVGLQEMRCKAVTEGVGGDAFPKACFSNGPVKGFLNMSIIDMITPLFLRFFNASQ